jgi:hypothetical protein
VGFSRVTLAPGERRSVPIQFAQNALTVIDEAGVRQPLQGVFDVAIGGRQPDRTGRYASDAEGVTTSVHIDKPPARSD